jgi:type IV secretory pathway protease TraF
LTTRLAATVGDRVTIDGAGVEVNGVWLANSQPSVADAAGRPARPTRLLRLAAAANNIS